VSLIYHYSTIIQDLSPVKKRWSDPVKWDRDVPIEVIKNLEKNGPPDKEDVYHSEYGWANCNINVGSKFTMKLEYQVERKFKAKITSNDINGTKRLWTEKRNRGV